MALRGDPAELRLTLDPDRALPACDPDQRFAMMSLGAALENLLVAARAWGLQPTVQYLPFGTSVRAGAPLVVARVTWTPGDQPRDRMLFASLPDRRSNPDHYGGRAITMSARAQLLAQVPETCGFTGSTTATRSAASGGSCAKRLSPSRPTRWRRPSAAAG